MDSKRLKQIALDDLLSSGPGDTTAPTVAITSTATSPTLTAPVAVTITFSEAVTGFAVGDITISGGSLANFATSDNIVFTVDWTLALGANTMDINAGVCQDAAGNNNTAATQFSMTYGVTPSITPALGAEIWEADAAAFTSGIYNWTAYGTNSVTNDANSLKIAYVDNVQGAFNYLTSAGDLTADLTAGTWFKLALDAKVDTANSVGLVAALYGGADMTKTVTNTDFASKVFTFLSTNATNNIVKMASMGAGEIIWLDNCSIKPFTAASLIGTTVGSAPAKNGTYQCRPTLTADTHCGMVIEYQDANNFVTAFHDGANAGLYKRIGGTVTRVIETNAAYSAGAVLQVVVNGTTHQLFYNGSQVGTDQTIDNSGMGLGVYGFSTLAANSPGAVTYSP